MSGPNQGEMVASVFVGSFGSQRALDAYLSPRYDPQRRELGPCQFMVDAGIGEADIEWSFLAGLSEAGRERFVEQFNVPEYAPAAWDAIQRLGSATFDAVISVHAYQHSAPLGTQCGPVRYVGAFRFTPDDT